MIDTYGRRVVLAWESFKDWLSLGVHLTHHELHVVVGLLIFVAAAKLLRRRLSSFVPLLPVATLEAANETSDYARYMLDRWPWTAYETVIDIVLTLGPPILLILTMRLARWLQ